MSSVAGSGATERFGPKRRLLLRREFDAVFKDPQLRLRRGPLWGAVRPSDSDVARLGLIVGKKVLRRAVDRNRAKRMIRESFRRQRRLPAVDIVVRLMAAHVSRKHADRLFVAMGEILARRAEHKDADERGT